MKYLLLIYGNEANMQSASKSQVDQIHLADCPGSHDPTGRQLGGSRKSSTRCGFGVLKGSKITFLSTNSMRGRT